MPRLSHVPETLKRVTATPTVLGQWEKLLSALVFEREGQLKGLGYTEVEAKDRLRYDFGAFTEFPEVLDRIRSEL